MPGGEKVPGVQGAIAEILKSAAVKLIRAGFRDDVDDGSSRVAVLSAESTGLHAELLERIRVRRRIVDVQIWIPIASPVELIIDAVGAGAARGDRQRSGVAEGEGGVAGAAGIARIEVSDAGRQQDQRRRVAAVQRQLDDLALFDCLSERAGLGVDLFGVSLHLDGFVQRAELQRDDRADSYVHRNHQAALLVFAERGRLRGQIICPRRQQRKDEPAIGGAGRFPSQACGL